MADPAMEAIDRAKSVQDCARILERHAKASSRSSALSASVPRPQSSEGGSPSPASTGPLLRLNLSHLTLLCGRLAALVQAGAHPGLGRRDAMQLTHKLMDQVCKELTVTPAAPLHLSEIILLLDAWVRLGYEPLQAVRSDILYQLSPSGGDQLHSASAEDLSSLAWSLQRLGWADKQLMRHLLSLAGSSGLDSRSLLTFTKALSSRGEYDRDTFLELGSLSRPLLPKMGLTESAQFLYTLVKADAQTAVFFSTAASQVMSHIHSCMPRDLAWLAGAYAEAGFMHRPLFQQLVAQATKHADSMDRRELAWLLRSLAMMKVYDARLFACLTKAVLRYLTTVLPKETAEHRLRTQAEAAGSRGSVRGGLLSLYNSVDMGLADRSDPINEPSSVFSDLADIVWGFAKPRHYDETLFNAIADAAVTHMNSADPSHLGQLCWSFQEARHFHTDLMTAAAAHGLAMAQEMTWAQSTLPPWSSMEQQAGSRTAGCAWLAFFPGPGSVGRSVGPARALRALGSAWGLVSVIAFLGCFNQWRELTPLMQSLHPLLVHMVQPQQSHPLWGQSEDLCLLLEPLAQLLQVGRSKGASASDRAWERHWGELALQVLMSLNARLHSASQLSVRCRTQVMQCYIALVDAGWRQEVTTTFAGGTLFKDLLATWKQQLNAPLSKQQAAWQGKLARMLADLGASNITLSPHTPDGLFTCLVQATVKGRTLAVDVPGLESYAGNAKCLVRALAAQSQGRGAVVVTKGLTELPVTPSVLYPQGWVTLHTSPDLPLPDSDPASGGPLFGLGFRARAMLVRGWVPVLLPEWDWRAVVRNEDAARRYLADQVMAAIRRAPAHR